MIDERLTRAYTRARARMELQFPTTEGQETLQPVCGGESLTKTETKYVQAAAYGMEATMIAETYGVSPHTVRGALKQARFRTGAKNTTHLVYLRLKDGTLT